jgi:uncharacterized protein YjiS (DUF1127 family)
MGRKTANPGGIGRSTTMTTTGFTHTQRFAFTQGLKNAFEAGANRVAALWTAAKNRRAVNQLLSWDEHALKDIGVTRGDVRSALAVTAPNDPSYRLRTLRGERRVAAYGSRHRRQRGLEI